MNSYIINKDSWHYKMVSKNRQWDMIDYDGPKDFCSYWSLVMADILYYSFIAFGVGLILLFTGMAFYANPIFTGVYIGGSLAIFFGTFGLLTYYSNRSKGESIFAMKYRSWKDKVCNRVEYR